MSNTIHLCPPEGTFHNGRRVDPVEGLVVPKQEGEYLATRGWRPKAVVDAELEAKAKTEAEEKAKRDKRVRAELAKHEAKTTATAPTEAKAPAVKATALEKKEG